MQNQHWFCSTRVSSIPKIIKLVQANTNTNKPNTNNFSTIGLVYFVKMFKPHPPKISFSFSFGIPKQ